MQKENPDEFQKKSYSRKIVDKDIIAISSFHQSTLVEVFLRIISLHSNQKA
jgi:hypothetical protein